MAKACIKTDSWVWDRHLARWRRLHAPPPFPRQLLDCVRDVLRATANLPVSSRWALVRTWLNGWCTKRRFQQQGPCVFCGCAEDSLEHFTCCQIVRQTGLILASIPRRGSDRLSFLLLDGAAPAGESLVRHVTFWHTLYRTHNYLRYNATEVAAVPERIRTELRGLLIRHGSLRAAFPATLPLVGRARVE